MGLEGKVKSMKVICPDCQTENTDSVEYCEKCGLMFKVVELPIRTIACPNCGDENQGRMQRIVFSKK